MHIKKLGLNNFKCFESANIVLDPRLNLIVGENSSGKTTLLKAIRAGLEPFVQSIIGILSQSEDYNAIEPIEKVSKIVCSAKYGGTNIKWNNQTPIEKKGSTKALFDSMCNDRENLTISEYPVIVYYGANRIYENSDCQKDPTFTISDAYMKWASADYGIDLLKSWTKYRASISGTQYDPYLELLDRIISEAIPDARSIYYDQAIDDTILVFTNGDRIPLDNLGKGTLNLLSLFGDLVWRCSVLNAHLLGGANESPGIVLIDEPALHLYPTKQRLVVGQLMRAFPNIQFLMATNSTFAINSYTGGLIFETVTQSYKHSTVNLCKFEPSASLTNEQVAKYIFGIKSDFGPSIEKELNEFYALRDKIFTKKTPDTEDLELLKRMGHELANKSTSIGNRIALEFRQMSNMYNFDF